MFTGIIQEIGEIFDIKKNKNNLQIIIKAEEILINKKLGDSISVNGVCQTITKLGPDWFEVESIPETLNCTNLGDLKIGDPVNLEGSLKVGDTLDGHFVLGHVDCTAKIIQAPLIKGVGGILTINKPSALSKFIVHKGSVTVNGVSLTISKVKKKSFEISLIPFTLNHTNLGNLQKNKKVNIEVDMIARYLLSNL